MEKNEALTGIMKARVLPEPVLAAPRMSRPQSAWGREALWMSVMTTNLAARKASLVFLESGNWPKREAPA